VRCSEQNRLADVLRGLSVSQQKIIRRALADVSPDIVHGWLHSGALHEWIAHSVRLEGGKCEASVDQLLALWAATPTMLAVLAPGEINEWMRAWLDIVSADANFSPLPIGLADLSGTERVHIYRLVRAAAYRSRRAAQALYNSLPRSLQTLSPPLRSLLLRCLQAAATFDPEPLPAVLPFLAPTLNALPVESQTVLLDRIAQLAQTFPAGVARLFRSLARAYEEVGEKGVQAWIAAGESIAQQNSQAGEAFFALESRTSLLLLRGSSPAVMLQDVHGVLLKYLHMLCGDALGIHESTFLSVPPPLADMPGESLPLPACVNVFPTYEENVRLYRVLTAQQAGRWIFGTYACSMPRFWASLPSFIHTLINGDSTPPTDLAAYFRLFPQPELLEALFLFVENQRVTAHLAKAYRGLREDLTWAASLTELLPPVLSTALPRLPAQLWRPLGKEATVYDSLALATELHAWLVAPDLRPLAQATTAEDEEEQDNIEGDGTAEASTRHHDEHNDAPLSAEQQEILRKIMKALRSRGGRKKVSRKKTTIGLVTFDDSVEDNEQDEIQPRKKRAGEQRIQTEVGLSYFYDEWDFLIEDYRTHWCQVREIPLVGDDGAFFSRTLATYLDLTEEIKREFRRLRPRLYRQVKGLEDGEAIDLDAAVAAQVDWRSGVTPSPKLYIARQPLERDVAALFLLDLSASTESLLAGKDEVRVIDVMKEAVVLLSAALDTIGDAYAIYGFSSRGRRNVEVYPVKTFSEPLSTEVRGRIGGLAPQRSTRMGAAVRHATRRLRGLSSRAKFLVLLSDGHPEDADYGPSAHAPAYGVRDTMMALREAERSGVLSFCLTIDKAGRDYLREMCAPSRYMIIDEPASLPAELPKIYQRHIRLQHT
jgi:hypothetical protein